MKCLTPSNKTSFMNSQNMSLHNTFLTQKVIFGALNGQLAAQGMKRRETCTNLDSQASISHFCGFYQILKIFVLLKLVGFLLSK